ncbi:MAG: hypothetical protein A4E45_01756 [Methanosaeta sp. PtaB.Bin039]|nr:MAG: hypothetical protein A4E45_01756 [Methanosaeta sp. PtaB.Bin039]
MKQRDPVVAPHKTDCQTSSGLSLDISHSLRPLRVGEEGRGLLINVHSSGGQCVAEFCFGAIALPHEMFGRLHPLIGERVGILNLSGYRVRCLERQ